MEFQLGFNIAVTLVGALAGWILKAISDSIKGLQMKDDFIMNELHQVHVLVAGNYVKRDELKDSMDAVFNTLRRIEDCLNGKADKP